MSSEKRLAAVKLNQPPVNRTENNTARRVEGDTVFRFRLVGTAFRVIIGVGEIVCFEGKRYTELLFSSEI